MKKVTRGVGWLNGLSHHPKDGTGVQTFFQPERRCAGDVVATPNGVLNGSGATPRGQHRKMKVDPTMCRDIKQCGRDQQSVGNNGDGVRCQLLDVFLNLFIPQCCGSKDRKAEFLSRLVDRRGHHLVPAPGTRRRSGKHSGHLMSIRDKAVQGGNGCVWGSSKENSHQPSLVGKEMHSQPATIELDEIELRYS